jgi:hypothetical protein
MRVLNEILDNINSDIAGSLKYPKAKYYTQAELQEKDGKGFPLVNNGNGKGFAISPNSNDALLTYHRVLGSETDTDWTKGKGRYPYKMRTYTMRMVWIGSTKRLPVKCYDTNDDVKNDVYTALPTVLNNKEIIRTISENVNKIEVLDTEFSGNNTKQLTLDVVAFWIDYEIKQNIKCN